MSSNLLGGLGVELYADMARLRQDMTEARKTVDTGAAAMRNAAAAASKALAALGLGLSTAAFVSWIRSAIDAGDEAFNLSKKVGIATRDLAGIQLAFKQAGVETGGMQTALIKLAKNVAEGDEVFKRLGVNVRNTDGSLKSSKQVLYDVSDVFARMPDGINKTALATEVFGKAGADLLPMLDGGSQGLRDMAEMAEKLGLVIDEDTAEAADKFNDTVDLLGMTSQGVGRKVAAQLLPTLNSLAGSLLDNVVSGDKLAKVAAILGAGLKVLFTVGAIGVEVFNTFGKVIGGVVGALVSVVSGEYRQAQRILEESGRDIWRGWGETAKTISDAWGEAGSKTVDQAVKVMNALGGTTVATKAQAEAAKKQREEQAKLAQAGKDYLLGLDSQLEAMRRELDLGRALTEGEKEQLKLEEQLTKGKLSLTAAEQESARAKLRQMDAMREQRRQADEMAKTLAEVARHTSKATDEQIRVTEAMRAGNVQLIEENEKLRIGEAAWQARQVAVLLNQAADLDWQAANEGGNFQLEEQARLLRERAKLLQDGVVVREAKAAADEWKKTSDQIGQGLTDSLYRAFESGKDFFSTLWSGIKNTFKVTALRLVVDVVMNPVKSALGGVLGALSGGASAASGGGLLGLGGGGNLGGNLLGMLGGFQNFGSGIGAGLGSLFGEAGFMGGLDAGFTALGAGNIGGGLGRLAGTLGPYVLGAAAIYSLVKKLDKSGTPHRGSVVQSGAGGLQTMWGDASRILDNYQGETDASLRGLVGAVTGGLNSASEVFGGGRVYDALAKFASDATDPSIGQFRLWQRGQSTALRSVGVDDYAKYASDPAQAFGDFARDVARQMRDEILGGISGTPQWARDQITALGDDFKPEQLFATVDAVVAMQRALTGVQREVAPLGGVFTDIASLSSDAAKQLADFGGGIEAFASKVKGYVGAYYSEGEQASIAAAGIARELTAAGFDVSTLKTRAEFRSLVDSRDVNTEEGRRQLAALLDVAQAFASVADYLQANGGTLATLAAVAPVLPAAATSSADAVTDRRTALAEESNRRMTETADAAARSASATEALVRVSQSGFSTLVERFESLSDAVREMARPTYLNDLANQP